MVVVCEYALCNPGGAHRTIGVPQGYVLGPLLFSGHARKQPTLSNVLNDEWRRNEEPRDRVRGSCCVSVSVSVGPRVSVAAVQVSVAQVHSVSGVQSGQVRHGQRPTAIQTRYIVTVSTQYPYITTHFSNRSCFVIDYYLSLHFLAH
ncbi:hypothetical protein J6590_041366 [Homalodisca vitripennis]|nr:hypothetical protein J6590_041366 [Homalodisca vitripennis]